MIIKGRLNGPSEAQTEGNGVVDNCANERGSDALMAAREGVAQNNGCGGKRHVLAEKIGVRGVLVKKEGWRSRRRVGIYTYHAPWCEDYGNKCLRPVRLFHRCRSDKN